MSTKVSQLVSDLVQQNRWDEAYSVITRFASQQAENPEANFEAGMLCFNIGKYADAERYLRKSLTRTEAGEAYYHLGLTLLKLNKAKEAIEAFRESCDLKPGNAVGHLHWGLALSRMGSYRGALGQFKMALKLNPRLIAAGYQAGVACYQLGMYTEAADYFNGVCERDNAMAEAYNGLGAALVAMDENERAITCFEKAWQLDDRLPSVKRNWATALVNLGKSDEATRQYQEAIRMGTNVLTARDRALIYNDWGVNLFRQGYPEQAAEKLLQAVEVDPGLVEARLNLGIVKNALQEYEQAADVFEKALEVNPDVPETNMLLGVSYFLLGQYDSAIERIRLAQQKEYRDQTVDIWIGYAYMAQKQYDLAEKHFEKAIKESFNNYMALDALGTCLAIQERHLEAIEKFKACLAINKDYAMGHLHLARSYEACGRSSEALNEYRVGVNKDPQCLLPEKEVIDSLVLKSQYDLVMSRSLRLLEVVPTDEDAQLALAKALKAQNRLDEAAQVLANMVAQHPDNGAAQVLEGQIYLAQGRLLEADEKFRSASLLFEGDTALYFGWGKTLGLLGLHELALEKFQKANEIDPYDSDTYEAWGATLKALGRFQEAADVYKRAAEYI